jgi:hypothetical protein
MPTARLRIDLEFLQTAIGLGDCKIVAVAVGGGFLDLLIKADDIPAGAERVVCVYEHVTVKRRFEKVVEG